MGDAEWYDRLGFLNFKRCLSEVLDRRDINGFLVENVLTEPLLAEVIATLADKEARNTTDQVDILDDGSPTSPADGIDDDEPTLNLIEAPASLSAGSSSPPAGGGGGSVSVGEGNLADADTRPPLPRIRSRPQSERMKRTKLSLTLLRY